jgi:TolB protein
MNPFPCRRLVLGLASMALAMGAAPTGEFEQATDIGKISRPGSAGFDAATRTYRITGGGKNMWFKEDAFHFLWKRLSGDLEFTMDVAWPAGSTEPHRKACAVVRQGLEADDAYVDAAVHGDGLIELQYRAVKGGTTFGIRTPIKAPATVRLERNGDVFTVSAARPGGPFQPVGSVLLALADPVCVGLGVTAHNSANLETALVSNVVLQNRVARSEEKRVRETSLETLVVATGERRVVHRERSGLEAPNWSRDGRQFFVNRDGGIYTLPVSGGGLQRLNTGGVDRNNNDHGLSFDGQWLALSSGRGENGSLVYVVPATGGEPRLITPTGPSYWHGWSPDGKTLAYCAKRDGNFDVYTVPVTGGVEQRLTTAAGLDDGCEYTADGTKIYFHSDRTGLMKIWRMNPDGSAPEQVTTDPDYADWFPHPSPDGKWLIFLSFDKSVAGHPKDQPVTLRLMPLAGGQAKVIASLFGGQGSFNVPSWSPDSSQVAFASYRHVLP